MPRPTRGMRFGRELLPIFVAAVTLASQAVCHGQSDDFFARQRTLVLSTQTNQPSWATPLVTVSPRIEQGFRADFVRTIAPNGRATWNLGNAKGLQFIPFRRTEFRFNPPPFLDHNDPALHDGFGDIAFRVKTRLYGSNERHHNAIVTAELSASIPTGKNANGSCCAVMTPALEIGKGFGRLALTTSGSGTIPASNTGKLGRSIVWNNAIQYHATRLLWLETEFNSTFYRGGKNDGSQQTFTTPGLIVSRIPLSRTGRYTLTVGVGEQIALTHFNTYNHAPILTGRLRF